MDYNQCVLQSLTETSAFEISQWEYEKPYDVYNFKGRPNGYLLNKETWGKEQFCLADDDKVIGFVACQYDHNDLWVGWSLSPLYCGLGQGHLFIKKCIEEIRKEFNYYNTIFLRVAAWNKRAVQAYQKAGFAYKQTIKDEVAYTNVIEDFWVMTHKV